MEVVTLSPPQMHALLDHLCTRQAGGQALLDTIHRGNVLTRPESFLDKDPSHLLQSFFDALPDHQVTIKKGSTVPTKLEVEVNNAATALQTGLTDICAGPTLMLNFKPTVIGVTTIDLTSDKVIIKYPPERGNIIAAQRDERDTTKVIPDNATSLRDESLMSAAPSLPGSTAPPVVGPVSGQPHSSLKINKQPFSPESIKQVQNLMSKENTAAALALIGIDEAISCMDAVAAQELDAEMEEDSPDEKSDDGPSDRDLEEDEKVSLLSDKEDEEATGGGSCC